MQWRVVSSNMFQFPEYSTVLNQLLQMVKTGLEMIFFLMTAKVHFVVTTRFLPDPAFLVTVPRSKNLCDSVDWGPVEVEIPANPRPRFFAV